jgi:hypothetical protein
MTSGPTPVTRAALFGSEKNVRLLTHLSLFNVVGDAVFDYLILGELRNASRQVLAKALGRPAEPRCRCPAPPAWARRPGRPHHSPAVARRTARCRLIGRTTRPWTHTGRPRRAATRDVAAPHSRFRAR